MSDEVFTTPSDLVVKKIDDMVQQDNLSTRSGLKLIIAVFRDAMLVTSSLEKRIVSAETAYIRFTNIMSEKKELEESNKKTLDNVVEKLDKIVPAYNFMKWALGVAVGAIIVGITSYIVARALGKVP